MTSATGLAPATMRETRSGAVSTRRGFRPDVEGLRAVAVLAVLIYHLKSSVLPGGFIGVDVFFVISGFLITSHLVREHESTGRIALARFYARRALRLIPAATVVLLCTAAATFIFVPPVVWSQYGTGIIASAFYVVNWLLASQSINYLDQGAASSPVMHFWSLAVEEQFYLIWPLLIIVAALVAVRLGLSRRVVMGVAGGLVVVLSFGAALWGFSRQDPSAYFTTTTRLWELAIGAVAAIAYPFVRERLTRVSAAVLCYVGVVAVVASLLFIRDENLWPGPLTAIPVIASALILISGGGRFAASLPERALGLRGMVWVGGLSYSLYLWHWPIIAIATIVWPDPGLAKLAALGVASVALAWLTHIFIENPVRFSPWAKARARRGLILGLVCALVSGGAGWWLIQSSPHDILTAPQGSSPAGAEVLASDIEQTTPTALAKTPKWVLPAPLDAPDDVPVLYSDGCQQNQSDSNALKCTYGDTSAKKTVVLVGDSKAGQWLPALDAIASAHSLRLVLFTKSACALADTPIGLSGHQYTSCAAWNDAVLKAIGTIRPELIVTSQVQPFSWVGSGAQTAASATAMEHGLSRTLEKLQGHGSKVAVIADTPQTSKNVYECVAEHPDALARCSYNRAQGIAKSAADVQKRAVASLGGSSIDASGRLRQRHDPKLVFTDMTDAICPEVSTRCPAVIGNALIYRQGSHVTATYVRTVKDRLGRVLEKAGLL